MATEGSKHLFVLSFPNETLAKVAVGELKDLKIDKFISVKDYAVVTKAAMVPSGSTRARTPTRVPNAARWPVAWAWRWSRWPDPSGSPGSPSGPGWAR